MPAGVGSSRWTSGEMFVWCVALVGAAAALAVAWWLMRRWWRRSSDLVEPGPVWSLQQLRELKAAGQLTDEEYSRLAARMSAALKHRGP